MFKYVDPLIGSKHHSPVADRDVELGLGERALDVRGHVVRPLIIMAVKSGILRYKLHKEVLDIVAY